MTDEEEKKKKKKKTPMSDAQREKISGILSKGADLAKTIGGTTAFKGGIESLTGKKVSANDKGLSDSMDITTFHNAYGSRNTDNTGHDMSKMTEKERQRIYGV